MDDMKHAKTAIRLQMLRLTNIVCDKADTESNPEDHMTTLIAGLCASAQQLIKVNKIPLSVELLDTQTGQIIPRAHGIKRNYN